MKNYQPGSDTAASLLVWGLYFKKIPQLEHEKEQPYSKEINGKLEDRTGPNDCNFDNLKSGKAKQ